VKRYWMRPQHTNGYWIAGPFQFAARKHVVRFHVTWPFVGSLSIGRLAR